MHSSNKLYDSLLGCAVLTPSLLLLLLLLLPLLLLCPPRECGTGFTSVEAGGEDEDACVVQSGW
jgi:hypothetical protein